jgi:hypothetical protein
MVEIVLAILLLLYLGYRVVFVVPREIRNLNAKFDPIQLQLAHMETQLGQISSKLDRLHG